MVEINLFTSTTLKLDLYKSTVKVCFNYPMTQCSWTFASQDTGYFFIIAIDFLLVLDTPLPHSLVVYPKKNIL